MCHLRTGYRARLLRGQWRHDLCKIVPANAHGLWADVESAKTALPEPALHGNRADPYQARRFGDREQVGVVAGNHLARNSGEICSYRTPSYGIIPYHAT